MTRRDLLAITRDIWGSLVASVECGQSRVTVVVMGTIALTDIVQFVEAVGAGIEQADILAISPGRSGLSLDTTSVCR